MNDTHQGFILGAAGNVGGQPSHQFVHLGNGLRDRGDILLAPTTNLALDVTARFAIVGQALLRKLHGVQRSDDAVHFVVNFATLRIGHAGQRLIPQHATRYKLHHIKSPTNDGLVFTQHMHLSNWHSGTRQTFHDRKFALNGVG